MFRIFYLITMTAVGICCLYPAAALILNFIIKNKKPLVLQGDDGPTSLFVQVAHTPPTWLSILAIICAVGFIICGILLLRHGASAPQA